MGAYLSKEELELIDSSYYNFPYNKDLKMSCWEKYNSKNFDYYNGKRFFKISRKHYSYYTRGLIYGYYYNGDGYVSDDEIEEIEHAF
jgi:hypothetical protein